MPGTKADTDAKKKTPVQAPSEEPSPRQLAEELAEAGRKNADKGRELNAALEAVEEKEYEAATGKDLDFDVEAFIKTGSISKTDIPVLPGELYIDMHSLTARERITAEALVEREYPGVNAFTETYAAAKEVAVITMAVTRMNKQAFPVPKSIGRAASEEDKKAMTGKQDLFVALLNGSDMILRTLTVLYANLDVADRLKEDIVKK